MRVLLNFVGNLAFYFFEFIISNMGHRDYFDKKPTLGQTNNALVVLFGTNSFIFIILIFLKIVYSLEYAEAAETLFQRKILNWFTLSPEFSNLLKKPWSLLSYMFSHYSIMGFISNMFWLWAFGYVLQDLIGNKKLIPIYLYGGFFGGLVFILFSSYIPFFSENTGKHFLLEGCNSSLVALAIATTTLSPNYKIFQHIGSGFSLWILTSFFIAIDIAFIVFGNSAIGVAHLIAGIIGYLFIIQLKKGYDWSAWMYQVVYWIDDLFNPEKKLSRAKQKDKIFYKTDKSVYTKTPNITEQKVNDILDKINKNGYDSLSNDEKEFLNRASKEVE